VAENEGAQIFSNWRWCAFQFFLLDQRPRAGASPIRHTACSAHARPSWEHQHSLHAPRQSSYRGRQSPGYEARRHARDDAHSDSRAGLCLRRRGAAAMVDGDGYDYDHAHDQRPAARAARPPFAVRLRSTRPVRGQFAATCSPCQQRTPIVEESSEGRLNAPDMVAQKPDEEAAATPSSLNRPRPPRPAQYRTVATAWGRSRKVCQCLHPGPVPRLFRIPLANVADAPQHHSTPRELQERASRELAILARVTMGRVEDSVTSGWRTN
jgi:hypothetical protein